MLLWTINFSGGLRWPVKCHSIPRGVTTHRLRTDVLEAVYYNPESHLMASAYYWWTHRNDPSFLKGLTAHPWFLTQSIIKPQDYIFSAKKVKLWLLSNGKLWGSLGLSLRWPRGFRTSKCLTWMPLSLPCQVIYPIANCLICKLIISPTTKYYWWLSFKMCKTVSTVANNGLANGRFPSYFVYTSQPISSMQ